VTLGAVWSYVGRHVAKEASDKKTPCRPHTSGGGTTDAPPGHQPTRRAYEQGGVSIAVLLIKMSRLWYAGPAEAC
jgi:hypothetical protein